MRNSLADFWVKKVRLFQFRNYLDETVGFQAGVNLITGANAQGKTNLLEAISVALTGQSLRASASEMLHWNADEGLVSAETSGSNSHSCSYKLSRSVSRVTATCRLDDKPKRSYDLLGIFPVVSFWPDDLLAVRAAPELRRRLLDGVLLQLSPAYAEAMSRYSRVLKQRNRLLVDLKLGLGNPGVLESFTRELCEDGGIIRSLRLSSLESLSVAVSKSLADLSSQADEISLSYLTSGGGVSTEAKSCGETLQQDLGSRSSEELARATTVAGPHRDDLSIVLNGHPAKSSASEGQQRSIMLAWKLAEREYIQERLQIRPILALDDIFSELDASRCDRLIELLHEQPKLQVFITCTDATSLSHLQAGNVLTVASGHVRSA